MKKSRFVLAAAAMCALAFSASAMADGFGSPACKAAEQVYATAKPNNDGAPVKYDVSAATERASVTAPTSAINGHRSWVDSNGAVYTADAREWSAYKRVGIYADRGAEGRSRYTNS